MLDDFFVRAMLAGIGVALVAGPYGCFIVWRRQAYFGDTLAHSALLGVALGTMLQMSIVVAVFVVAVTVALALIVLQRQSLFSSDALLGMLSHSALALGLVVVAFMPGSRVDLMGVLFGDILAASKQDLMIIYGGGVLILLVLMMIWKPLFAATVNRDLALAEGMNAGRADLIFMVLMALVIAVSMKLVGVLLMTALLIIPALTVRRFSMRPQQMALLASFAGVLAVIAGLTASMRWDTPSGPSVVVAAFALFLLASFAGVAMARSRRSA